MNYSDLLTNLHLAQCVRGAVCVCVCVWGGVEVCLCVLYFGICVCNPV